MKAIWNGAVLADSNDTVIVEGNHYFPITSVDPNRIETSEHTSFCPWKGTASYYHVVANGQRNEDAAWFYPEPKAAAAEIAGRVAFWRGIEITE